MAHYISCFSLADNFLFSVKPTKSSCGHVRQQYAWSPTLAKSLFYLILQTSWKELYFTLLHIEIVSTVFYLQNCAVFQRDRQGRPFPNSSLDWTIFRILES